MCFTVLGDSGDAPVRCFFDFFIPLSSKTHTFESISGKLLSRNALKSRCFRWEGDEKVKKTSRHSSGGAGRLWRSGSALGGSGGAQGGPGRPKAASFALALNTGHILLLRRKTCALLRAKTSALLRRKTCAVLRARTCALFRANTKEAAFGRLHKGGRPSATPLCGFLCIGSEQSTCPSSQHSTCLASQQGRCRGSQQGTCLASQQ